MREEKEGGRGRWGNSVELALFRGFEDALPGLHRAVSAGAVAPSAGRVHPPNLGAQSRESPILEERSSTLLLFASLRITLQTSPSREVS